MTEKKTVYRNFGGVRRTMVTDDERPGVLGVHTEQVIDEILDGIARDREIMPMNGDNKLVARVPISIYERSVLEEWDDGDWRRWLNSAEAAPFRIWKGMT